MDVFAEIDHWWLFALGVVLLLVTVLDLLWTTIAAAAGRGPLSMPLTEGLWRLLVAGSPSRRRRQVAGYLVVVALPILWLALLVTGFSLLYFAGDQPIADANKPGAVTGLTVVAYTMGGLAGAGAGYTASTGFWELVNNLSAIVGLGFFTLTITFVLRVVNADARGRAMASDIAGLGPTPQAILERALREPDSATLPLQVVTLSSKVSQVAQDHLSLPVLRFVESVDEQTSVPRSIVVFDEVLTLLDSGLVDSRPLLVAGGRSAVEDYVQTMRLRPADGQPPPGSSLVPPRAGPRDGYGDGSVERAAVVSSDDFRGRLVGMRDRRTTLGGLLARSGWSWADVHGPGAG